MTTLIRALRMWAILARAALRAEMQHRVHFFFGMLGGLAVQALGLVFIATILSRFGDLGGWTFREILLLYGMRLTAHALWVIPFASLFQITHVVRSAEFDRYLVRPLNPLIQLMTRRMTIVTIGHLVGGVAILAAGMVSSGVDWTPVNVLLLAAALVGGALTEMSFQLVLASLAFRLHGATEMMLTLDSVFNSFGNYPIKIFGPVARWSLTTVFPLAFAAYFPAAVLLGRTGELWVLPWIAVAAPAVGVILAGLAYLFWQSQTRYYSSSGN
ncbi:ABC-2 family transporter protein [Nonomuraea sp. B1E8]|uniref:ABC transporter permease n=1 Tax=unclassified Nonomuraea TaxID=2593643 RepID=UPI00325F609A